MPVYDYECPTCSDVKEVSHSVSEIGKIEVLCEQCREPMKKLLSLPTLIGFDNVGRSIGKKEKEQASKTESSATSTAKKENTAKPAAKKDKAA
jgi:putative FmdB family regulatory protein